MESVIELSAAEVEWLKRHPIINIGIDEDYLPLEGLNEKGDYVGIGAEYAKILQQSLPIRFSVVKGVPWSELEEKIKNGEIDAIMCLAKTPERSKNMFFTDWYQRYPVGIFVRDTAQSLEKIEQLQGRQVAVVNAYWIQSLLQIVYPDIILKTYESQEECLVALAGGMVDAYVGDTAAVSHTIKKLGLMNLRLAGKTTYFWEYRIGVRKDWPQLVPILNKALKNVPPKEQQKIQEKWGSSLQAPWWMNREVQLVIASAFAVMLLIFTWNRLLKIEVKKKTYELQAANETLEMKVEERTENLTALNQELRASNEELADTLERLEVMQVQLIEAEKLAYLGGLVAGVAHEINTPLGSAITMGSYLETTLEEIRRELRQTPEIRAGKFVLCLSDGQEAAQMLLKSLKKIDWIVRDFKLLAAEHGDEKAEEINVSAYLKEFFRVAKQLLPDMRKHCVEIDCDEALSVNTYPGVLDKILMILLKNTGEHAYEPGKEGRLSVRAYKTENFWLLEYGNDGKRFEDDELRHIFEPFFTTKRGMKHSGLGLAILQSMVVKKMNGSVSCCNKQEQGVLFVLKINLTA